MALTLVFYGRLNNHRVNILYFLAIKNPLKTKVILFDNVNELDLYCMTKRVKERLILSEEVNISGWLGLVWF